MSENILVLIPEDESFIPKREVRENGYNLLKTWFSYDVTIELDIPKNIEFYDAGSNLETINCPNCNAQLSMIWWQDAMNIAYQSKFKRLVVQTPCCQVNVSLNSLVYKWASGFASFAFIIRNPKIDLNDHQIKELSYVLKCNLRKIWQRY